jgi:hypothetical protein
MNAKDGFQRQLTVNATRTGHPAQNSASCVMMMMMMMMMMMTFFPPKIHAVY